MAKISVLGAGSWGTALSVLLNNNGHEVRLWSRFQEEVDTLKQTRELTSKLPGVHIPENIDLTADVKNCVETAEVIVLAVPSPYVRGTAELMAPYVKDEQIIVNVAKGIEEKTLMTMTDIISEEIPAAGVYVLSGPSHAEEVGRGIPTTCVISGPKRETAEYLQGIFMSPVFRVYTTPDTLGVELGGSLKNVIALAAGTADGLGYGDNTKAALITRGIAEIARLGTKMGAHMETFYGLKLAYEAGRTGGSLPTVFNAANERAVAMFLDREIGYLQIPEIIAGCMEMHKVIADPTVEEILQTEQETYEYIKNRW